jgi:hypothetical protein
MGDESSPPTAADYAHEKARNAEEAAKFVAGQMNRLIQVLKLTADQEHYIRSGVYPVKYVQAAPNPIIEEMQSGTLP